MKITETSLPGVFEIDPKIWGDERGYFFESYRDDKFEKEIMKIHWVQENESMSLKGVLRGLHYQMPPFAQSKLVRVIRGRVLDVAVDIRRGSPNFGKHVAIELSEFNKKQLFIPRGFAHGFLTLEENSIFAYKVDNFYNKDSERSILFDDPEIGIQWDLEANGVVLSEKDRVGKTLSQAEVFPGMHLY
jgi:dTDP-4-dehydrorhamnose 3,5-epimerase